MLEVKGRANVFWYWAAVGVLTSLSGWWLLGWFSDQGLLLRLVPVAMAVSGVIFVGIGIFKALDKRPVIIVNENGLLDRTSFPHRRLAWNDIVKFRLVTVGGRAPVWLAIDLVDPARMINKAL